MQSMRSGRKGIQGAVVGVVGFVIVVLLLAILLPVAMDEVAANTGASSNLSSGTQTLLENIDIFAVIGAVLFGLGVAGVAVGRKFGAFGG